MYVVYSCMHRSIINEKESLNLKENSKEGYTEGAGGRKKKGEVM